MISPSCRSSPHATSAAAPAVCPAHLLPIPAPVQPVAWALSATVGSLVVVAAVVVRIFLGWSYVGNRLMSAAVEYEETGWYDGEVFVKPPEVLTRDRLLGMYEVRGRGSSRGTGTRAPAAHTRGTRTAGCGPADSVRGWQACRFAGRQAGSSAARARALAALPTAAPYASVHPMTLCVPAGEACAFQASWHTHRLGQHTAGVRRGAVRTHFLHHR